MKNGKKKAKKMGLDIGSKKEKKKAKKLARIISPPAKFPQTYGLGGNANFVIHSDENGTVWHIDINTGNAKRVTFAV